MRNTPFSAGGCCCVLLLGAAGLRAAACALRARLYAGMVTIVSAGSPHQRMSRISNGLAARPRVNGVMRTANP